MLQRMLSNSIRRAEVKFNGDAALLKSNNDRCEFGKD